MTRTTLPSYFRTSERYIPALIRRWKRPADAADVLYGRGFLENIIPAGGVGVEIGVYRGGFSRWLVDHLVPKHLTLVDPWRPFDFHGDGVYDTSLARMDRRYRNVCCRFRAERQAGQIRILRLTALEAAHHVDNESLDWVYVDGDHREEAVRADIAHYWPKLRASGFMVFDDYGYPGSWRDGVTKACDALLPTRAAERVAQEAHQLVVQKRAHLPGGREVA
jgi:hypothetical protein